MGGTHLLIDARATRNLMDRAAVVAWMQDAARLTGMTVLGVQSHLLPSGLDSGPGVSAVQVIAESHIAVHTWPEHGVVTMDFYSCVPFDTRAVSESFRDQFGVSEFLLLGVVERFGHPGGPK